jgi:hypothetical protein
MRCENGLAHPRLISVRRDRINQRPIFVGIARLWIFDRRRVARFFGRRFGRSSGFGLTRLGGFFCHDRQRRSEAIVPPSTVVRFGSKADMFSAQADVR